MATKTLAPIRPNAGARAAYQKALDRAVDEMTKSVEYWVKAQYRKRPPELAQDASPAVELEASMRRLSRRWQRKFNKLSRDLAEHFTRGVTERVDGALEASLKANDFTVRFKATAAQNDAYQAVAAENVGLIRSIPQKYLGDVQGQVMRSAATGRDLTDLSADLEKYKGITKRRAALIARDQNNKATAVFTRVRQDELGITQAKWKHSGGGVHPRPEHVAFSGKIYDVKKGAFLEGKWVWPGTEINCRCVSQSVLPNLKRID